MEKILCYFERKKPLWEEFLDRAGAREPEHYF